MKTRLLAALENLDRGDCEEARRELLAALTLMPVGSECGECGSAVEPDGLCRTCHAKGGPRKESEHDEKEIVSPAARRKKSRLPRLSQIAASLWAAIYPLLKSI